MKKRPHTTDRTNATAIGFWFPVFKVQVRKETVKPIEQLTLVEVE